MLRYVIALSALLLACGSSEPPAVSPSVETTGRTERFEVPIGDGLIYAEIRTTEVVAPAGPDAAPLVRAAIRLCRDNGTDAGVAWESSGSAPGWTGVVPGDGIDVTFHRLEVEAGVPAALNGVVLHVKASVDDANRVVFDVRSNAICIR